ncbi:MAG: helix-hairpin-helix domain-containing protein [Nocardioides sp.]
MSARRPSPEHQEAVSRRLALLSAELAAVRPLPEPEPDAAAWAADHTRVVPLRAVRPLPDDTGPPGPPGPVPAAEPPALPEPGRHAAHRPRARGVPLGGLVPETLRGRVLLGPAQLAVVAVVVALGLAATCWWVVRGDPSAVAAPTLPAAAPALTSASPVTDALPAPSGALSGAASPGAPTGEVTVDVAGKVRRPGIVVLDAGSRVVDALRAAGGARPGVDLVALNLARVLVDGEQILVGVPGGAGLPGALTGAAPATGAAPVGALVNLNTASETELEGLPEVGPVTAQSILQWRSEHGGFTSVDELLEVDGIGDATLAKLTPYVTV